MHNTYRMKHLLLLLTLTGGLAAVARAQAPASANAKDTTVYKERQPQFPGGGEMLYTFIDDSLRYPAEAKEKRIEGTVVIQFVVSDDGSITRIKVLQGVGGGCTEEAIRIIKAMPKWIPGTKDGKPNGGIFNLPIVFQLPPEKKANK